MTAPLSAAELATVARFDAGPDAPESLRERVADELARFVYTFPGATRRLIALEMADAAIAVITGGAS